MTDDGPALVRNWYTFFSSPEPKAPRWAISIPVTPSSVRPSSVRQHFQTSSPLKPLGQLNSNFIWRLLRMGEWKFVQMFLVTWPRWLPCPYMVKTLLKSSSPEPEGRWPLDLVCSIRDVGPTKFVQTMILGWPWPTKRQGQICFLMYLNGIFFEKLIFWILLKP